MERRFILVTIRLPIILCLFLSTEKVTFSQAVDSVLVPKDSIFSILDTSDYYPGDNSFNLIVAASKGYDKEVLRLLKKRAYINTKTTEGVTPLMYAVQNRHRKAAKILLLNGANPDLKPYKGPPALLVAIGNHDPEISEMLIRNGADINIRDHDERTPLMHAAAIGNARIADLLLYYEAPVNLADDQGITALMIACYFGYTDITKLLIDNKATLEKEDQNGYTALHYATQNNHTEIVELLLSHEVNIEKKNNAGYTPLSLAVATNHKDLTVYYVEKGADVNSKISGAYKPLNVAKKNKNDSIIHLLEENHARASYFPSIDYGSIHFDFSLNAHDFLFGGGIGVHDSRYGLSTNVGFVTRIPATEILEEVEENVYYQYWEKRSYFYLNLTERLPVYSWAKDHWFGFGLGGQVLYTYGKYRGSDEKPSHRFILSPQVLTYAHVKYFAFSLSYEYVNFKIEGLSPHRFVLGIHFLIPGKRIREPVNKEILY